MSKQQEYSSDVVVACLQPICYPTQWNMNALPYRAFFGTRYLAVSRLLDVCCGAAVGQQWNQRCEEREHPGRTENEQNSSRHLRSPIRKRSVSKRFDQRNFIFKKLWPGLQLTSRRNSPGFAPAVWTSKSSRGWQHQVSQISFSSGLEERLICPKQDGVVFGFGGM